MKREDMSAYLIHWTSGDSDEEAYDCLYQIISTEELRGNVDKIKGSYSCICFTETPGKHFYFTKRKYKPFGVAFTKQYLFGEGARPVIYESEEEFAYLPENVRWRHVLYNPCVSPPIDFTWEREWRVRKQLLYLDNRAKIVVPNDDWRQIIMDRFNSDEYMRYWGECVGYGQDLAEFPRSFPFEIFTKDNIND